LDHRWQALVVTIVGRSRAAQPLSLDPRMNGVLESAWHVVIMFV
jgi:hypothetical protein